MGMRARRMNSHEAVMWGCFGGILPEVLRLVAVR